MNEFFLRDIFECKKMDNMIHKIIVTALAQGTAPEFADIHCKCEHSQCTWTRREIIGRLEESNTSKIIESYLK